MKMHTLYANNLFTVPVPPSCSPPTLTRKFTQKAPHLADLPDETIGALMETDEGQFINSVTTSLTLISHKSKCNLAHTPLQ